MRLIVVHYHYRPGGIRRIVEQGAVCLAQHSGLRIDSITLAGGEPPDPGWRANLAASLRPVALEEFIEPAFGYFAEQRHSPKQITARIRAALPQLFRDAAPADTIVWAHNLALGRNPLLSRELAAFCARRRIRLVAHHHDWWFDNRWQRWPELQACGLRTLPAVAQSVLPSADNVCHVAINGVDAGLLRGSFRKHAEWLPNLTERTAPPAAAAVKRARQWLAKQVGERAPVWLVPCRLLRRKNIAESLLLTRWMRPDGWLVTTGLASSADEMPYFKKLEQAARRHRWPLRLGVLGRNGPDSPTVPELLAASEVILLTSIQEGFGLPYLEAAVAGRPLIARSLPIIAPDLARFGLRFPHLYDEVRIAPELFDWRAEQQRQKKLFQAWLKRLPREVRRWAQAPEIVAATTPAPVPFSRLTLTAQLEVLAQPVAESRKQCLALNQWLAPWQHRAETGTLLATRWPRQADAWLSGRAYGRRFGEIVTHGFRAPVVARAGVSAQRDFMQARLNQANLFPLLWSRES